MPSTFCRLIYRGDNFDLNTSHVIPALIRKCIEAKERNQEQIVLWGDGSPTREFVYVEDAAEGIISATENYDGEEPVNLGTGREIYIRDLAQMIAEEVGFRGDIVGLKQAQHANRAAVSIPDEPSSLRISRQV